MAMIMNDNKEKANPPKVLVLKWGNHRHRILINNDDVEAGCPASEREAPLPEPKKCSRMVAASPALPPKLRTRKRTLEMGVKEEEKKISRIVENCKKINVSDEKKNLRSRRMRKKEPMLKLAVPLSKSKIEEDFLKMIGKKPPSRPKKRSRLAQQDSTYLGLSLDEIPNDRYDVPKLPLA
ncbi:uncharacterized protein LOC120067524 [Benincasa hispida]|uniref:uncharacterized protein LOC120067524 n=1 Tax=Benincasa hispida TaxID=102211 RepID=UPI0019011D03|nr:uncharacterized protein LOC120067524 [Benincasa hispida]